MRLSLPTLITILIALAMISGCGDEDEFLCRLNPLKIDETFKQNQETVTIDVLEEVEIDSIWKDTLVLDLSLIGHYDTLLFRAPDTLITVLDGVNTDTTILDISTLDFFPESSTYLFPDSIVFSKDSLFRFTELVSKDSVLQGNTINIEYELDFCDLPSLASEVEAQAVQDFIEYLVDEWNIDTVQVCLDSTDVSDDYSDFKIRFDYESSNNSEIVFSYYTTNGFPIFSRKGNISFLTSNILAISEFNTTLLGTRVQEDDVDEIALFEVPVEQQSDLINLILPTGFDCDNNDGGRIESRQPVRCLGRRRVR